MVLVGSGVPNMRGKRKTIFSEKTSIVELYHQMVGHRKLCNGTWAKWLKQALHQIERNEFSLY